MFLVITLLVLFCIAIVVTVVGDLYRIPLYVQVVICAFLGVIAGLFWTALT